MIECHVKHYLVVAGNIDHNTLSWCLELTHKYLYLLYIHIYKSLKMDNRTALVLKGFVIDKAGLRQKPERLCQTSYGESEASCSKCVRYISYIICCVQGLLKCQDIQVHDINQHTNR